MPHYTKAPITEALIDLRVQLPAERGLADLEQVHVREANFYPQKRSLVTVHAKIRAGREASAQADQEQHGIILESQDKRHICQLQLGGFTLSRLAPYETWESLRTEARRLWNIYREIAQPTKVTRIAVRYVNRLDLPLPLKDFRDFFRTVPEVSPALPQGLSGLFMQLQIPQSDISCMLILNETLVPPARAEVVSVVLDIDLFRQESLPPDDEEVWGLFEVLHARKNEVFEACITDRTRELIS